MNRTKAQNLARTLMDQHGLQHVPFKFDRAVKRLGMTTFRRYPATGHEEIVNISLSAVYVDLLPEDEIRDTILHEIAHAKAGFDAGHNHEWRRIARSIGCNAMRCATPSAKPNEPWQGICANGHRSQGMHRAPQRVRSCSKCSRTWKLANVYTWYKDGKRVELSDMPSKYQAEMMRVRLRYG